MSNIVNLFSGHIDRESQSGSISLTSEVYPLDLQQSATTTITPRANKTLGVTAGGSVRGAAYHVVSIVDISVTHPLVSNADKATLEDFYTEYRYRVIEFTYHGDSSKCSVMFQSEPTYTWIAPDVWNIEVYLTGTKT